MNTIEINLSTLTAEEINTQISSAKVVINTAETLLNSLSFLPKTPENELKKLSTKITIETFKVKISLIEEIRKEGLSLLRVIAMKESSMVVINHSKTLIRSIRCLPKSSKNEEMILTNNAIIKAHRAKLETLRNLELELATF